MQHMKFALYTISCSPHQLPLFKMAIGLWGNDACKYVAIRSANVGRTNMGWDKEIAAEWYMEERKQPDEARRIVSDAKLLMSGMRDIDLFEARCKRGLATIYCGERWFKPPMGILRLLHPKYFKMARRLVKLLRNSEHMYAFPIGIHAARDMARLCGLFAGDWKCLFRAPKLEFEKKPGGRIMLAQRRRGAEKYCLDKMRMWGYFVEGAKEQRGASKKDGKIKVLWVGRLLNWKRVDTIIKAVCGQPNVTLDIYGSGPMEGKLKAIARGYEDAIKFYRPVPIAEVRRIMREHDVYVLSSNGYEGWGAVASEALEEGMKVIGTYEAGSSATMLPESQLFHAADWRRLRQLLANGGGERVGIGEWSAEKAGEALVKFVGTKDE